MISGMDRIDFIHPDEVVYLKSTGRYTEFYLKDKKRKITSSKPIGEYENILDQDVFYRIHNSFLINLAQLININKRAGNYCEMSNGDSLPLSRRRYEGLMGYMRNR
jgi:two-component system LytT family response regulator